MPFHPQYLRRVESESEEETDESEAEEATSPAPGTAEATSPAPGTAEGASAFSEDESLFDELAGELQDLSVANRQTKAFRDAGKQSAPRLPVASAVEIRDEIREKVRKGLVVKGRSKHKGGKRNQMKSKQRQANRTSAKSAVRSSIGW